MNPESKAAILAERNRFLQTPAGKRLLELSRQMDEIIYDEQL